MKYSYLFVFISSFFFSWAACAFLKNVSAKSDALAKQSGLPLIGGLGIAAAFVLFGKAGWGILVPSLLMLVFGLIDDKQEMSVGVKFFSQALCAFLLIYFGVRTRIVYIGDFLNIIITLLWVLGITNAFNHLDIMDGLAGLAATLISASFFIISVLAGDVKSAVLSFALSGAAAGFLMMNSPPAKVYMGNSGSHFLGFVLAAVAITISYAPMERKVALVSPILILGLPIFDTAFLVLIRLKNGLAAFRKSKDHIALRFLKTGYSKQRALVYMGLLCLYFCLSGIVVSKAPNILAVIIICAAVLAGIAVSIRVGKLP